MLVAARKHRLRTFALGGAIGLVLGALVLVAQDLADNALGPGGPPLRRRARQVVAASEPYRLAVDRARAEPAVRQALGGAPAAVLETCALEDAQDATRLRFTLRLSGHDDAGTLEVEAVHARHAGGEPGWRFERLRFRADRTGAAVDLAREPTPAR